MTRRQYDRMCEFSRRMCLVAIRGGRWQKVLHGHVDAVLYELSEKSFGCHYSHVLDWDHNTALPPAARATRSRDYRGLLCDLVREYCWEYRLERAGTGSWRNARCIPGCSRRWCIAGCSNARRRSQSE